MVNFRFLILSFIAYLLPSILFAQNATVINGFNATEENKFMVSLYRQFGGEGQPFYFTCGGTFLDTTHILTAAHCVKTTDALAIGYGSNNLKSQKYIEVIKVSAHPEFTSETLSGDFAVLTLGSPAEVDTKFIPKLATKQVLKKSRKVKLYGWGTIYTGISKMPEYLQEANIPLWNQTRCQNTMGSFFNKDSMICAGKLNTKDYANNGVDSCFGDSGGPLLSKHRGKLYQIGVVSWTYGCASRFTPSAYAKVSAYRQWILEQLK
jgi:trypsin